MMEHRVADDRIEMGFDGKIVRVAQPIIDVRRASLLSGDSKHRLGNIHGNDRAEIARKLVAEQPCAATNIKNGIPFERQMIEEKTMLSLYRRRSVILLCKVVE